jgi:hypothetical protein
MGDRALVVFHDERDISPTVYLHWHGSSVPELLGELAEYMKGRYGDAEYAAARFTGLCHTLMPGNLSLGIQANTLQREDLDDEAVLRGMSHGDAGVVIVNTGEFTWKAYGGYLAGHRPDMTPELTLVKPSTPNE